MWNDHCRSAGALADLGRCKGDTLTVTTTPDGRTFSVLSRRNGTRVRFRSIGSSTVPTRGWC